MSPAVAQLVVMGLQTLIQEAPALVGSIREIINKDNPQPEDWAKLAAEVRGDTYEKLVPASHLTDPTVEQPPADPTPPLAGGS